MIFYLHEKIQRKFCKNKLKKHIQKLNYGQSFILYFSIMKKYRSLLGMTILILLIWRLWYQALFAYLGEHTYYFWILSSSQNRWLFISAILVSLIPIIYTFASSKVKIINLLISFIIWAWVFWLIHSNIKWDPIWFWNIITIFNTILLVTLWIYLILWFSAFGSWIERKRIKFSQFRRHEIFLTFWIWFCSFVIIVQILLWIWLLYWIVSRLLFLGLGFMIWYERRQLWKWWEMIWNILENFREWIISWERNLNSKNFWSSKKIWFLAICLPIIFSLAYLYMWIQNSFTPYSTAWDANHEYMYIPKILAENAGIYWWNTLANNMPWFWHQFLTFIFSLTGCTNWWFGLSPDNIAISMNNISAFLVLIFWIALVFQIFTLISNKKKNEKEKSEAIEWDKILKESSLENWNWIAIWWYMLLLWLTGWMWAFLVIVDNKTDLWVMALSLLALLAGLIFLQNRKSSDKKEVLKYVIIAWLFFGFATLAKITAFVDFVLFGLLLVWLRFSSLTSLGLWVMVMWFVRKFNILTSSVMLTDENATRFIIIWGIITIVWIVLHLLKRTNRKEFWKNIRDLLILWICFLIPLIVLKLPWATISQIKTDNYSLTGSLKSVFLSMDSETKHLENNKFLAQNTDDTADSLTVQDEIDNSNLSSRNDQTFQQCSSDGNIYSDEELNEWLQEIVGWQWWEDLWRYIWYGWKEFKNEDRLSVSEDIAQTKWFNFFKALWPKSDECSWTNNTTICKKNLMYWIMKTLRPTSETCYGLNHDAKVLCSNAYVIDSFKIDDLRAIYENWIKDKDWEAGLLLKEAIDSYDKSKSEWKIWFWTSNTAIFHDEIVNLRQYYQSHSISSDEDSVNIPYRYLVPLNISFNWSLQNLSSYYTDIGFFWIIVYVFLIIALPYALVKKDKILTSFSLTTLIGRWIWWIIGSAILRYGTVLISWTMITLALFWGKLLQKNSKNNLKIIPRILVIFIWIIFWVQLVFNFLRIASQWANSVFVWYKWNVWQASFIDDSLSQGDRPKTKYGYTAKNIFNLQFPQYNPIINALADRDNEDWVIVAWTYIQYFLWNQRNIKSDWMLWDFWKKTSDWNLCKTYRRLKKDNTRYLIVDPNIWTVSMWEGNETLFYRFFGKLNADKKKMEIDGTITTLIRLYKQWYLKLLSTNNLWSKYAFTLSDDVIKNYFWEDLDDEEIILTRWKMAVLKYFDDANEIFGHIADMFISRIMNDPKWWVEDIADIQWLEIDSEAVSQAAIAYINGQASEWFAKDLSQDERSILVLYINIYMWYRSWDSNISNMIQNLLINSTTGWSQIIALELN